MTSDGCVHHWSINPAEGPTSAGVCKKCGSHKDFYNSSTETSWETGLHSLAKSATRRKLLRRSGTASPDEIE